MATPYKVLLPTKVKVPMKLPPMLDTRFAQFLQALPTAYHQQAYKFKAFARARKIKSPLQLLQLVLAYCGLDWSLHSCAGEVAQMQGYLSDTAVKKTRSLCSVGKIPAGRRIGAK